MRYSLVFRQPNFTQAARLAPRETDPALNACVAFTPGETCFVDSVESKTQRRLGAQSNTDSPVAVTKSPLQSLLPDAYVAFAALFWGAGRLLIFFSIGRTDHSIR